MPSTVTVGPTLDEVLAYTGDATHIAVCTKVCTKVSVATETPLSLFQRLAGERPGAFLLEGAAGDELMGCYSFFGYDVDDMVMLRGGVVTARIRNVESSRSGDDPLTVLREVLQEYHVVPLQHAPRFQGGTVGYFGFDCVTRIERPVPLAEGAGMSIPDALALLSTALCVYDHLTRRLMVRLDGDELLLCPIAGTRPRGLLVEEDLALERELLADEKELAEHRMLVDLGRVARPGSVYVDGAMRIVQYSHVMHIVSDIRGRLMPGKDAYDVLRACFPAGTVSGDPKVRACELIARLEPDRRGVYAGAVGYIDFRGNMDTCIAIRTIVVTDGRASLQTGAGIVHDSLPSREVDECWNKARAGLVALAVARQRAGRRMAEPCAVANRLGAEGVTS